MTSRGFLIRFIDIGLIVLFGFVMISDIENTSIVELARLSGVDEAVQPDRDVTYVTIGIAADNSLSIDDTPLASPSVTRISPSEELEGILRQLKQDRAAEQQDLIVLIRPHPGSMVQRTVDVMDVCDRLALRKSLQTDFRSVDTADVG